MDEKNFPYTSLCMVTEINDKGVASLKRLADLVGGKFQDKFNPVAPPYQFLKNQNCLLDRNDIRIFKWRTEPHKIKEGRNFVDSKICYDKNPIEILILENCADENDLRNKLLNGIKFQFSTIELLIVYRKSDFIYHGVICSAHDFKQSGDEQKLKAADLDLFEVAEQNFVRIEDKIFYNGFDLGKPLGISYAKNFSDFIKDKIISRAKLTTFKNQVSQKDFKIFCDFIKNFSTEDFYHEIANERNISIEDAKKFFYHFISTNEKYLQSEIFQDEIFENIIEHCPNLLEKFEEITAEKWHSDNQEKIDAANLKLAEIQKQTEDELKNFIELESEIKSHQKTLEEINSQIKQREDFAAEVENKIAQRIDAAKKNAADFICEMAFVNPNFGAVQTSKNIFYRAGKIVDVEEYEIEEIEDIAKEIGIEKNFAAYLVAAYVNKISLLLAGSNARDIADAFSVTLTGKTAAIFDCANVTSLEDLEIVRNSDDEIISVLNPFAPNFIAYLPELVNCGKFIFAIYPFVEDLKIEPRSFYNYFLPVFTELVIDKSPEQDFETCYLLTEEFKKEYILSKIPILAKERIRKLKNLSPLAENKKFVRLFADFPLAYVQGKEEDFMEKFKDDGEIINKIKEFLGTENV